VGDAWLREEDVGAPTILHGAAVRVCGGKSEMGQLVMLEETFRGSPRGSVEIGGGYPPEFFRYELRKRLKRKEMGGKVYGKYGAKAVTLDE